MTTKQELGTLEASGLVQVATLEPELRQVLRSLAERVAATTRTSEKTSLLAAYLRTLEPAERARFTKLAWPLAVPGEQIKGLTPDGALLVAVGCHCLGDEPGRHLAGAIRLYGRYHSSSEPGPSKISVSVSMASRSIRRSTM